MAREEEIKAAAEIYYGEMYHKSAMDYFAKGAQWADKHSESESQWIYIDEKKPDFHTPIFVQEQGEIIIAVRTENKQREWYNIKARRKVIGTVIKWKPINIPNPR